MDDNESIEENENSLSDKEMCKYLLQEWFMQEKQSGYIQCATAWNTRHPKQFELKNGLILTSSIKSLLTNQFI